MPIYEYVCEACGRLTEVMQKISDPAPAACPECGEPKLARLVSRTSFQLRGGGWYADLYSSPKEKKAPSADGAAPSSGTSAPASPAAAAPAAAPASAPAPAASGGAAGGAKGAGGKT